MPRPSGTTRPCRLSPIGSTEKGSAGGVDAMLDFFLSLQVWGTPEQWYRKILEIRERTGGESFVGVFSYDGMRFAEAERNLSVREGGRAGAQEGASDGEGRLSSDRRGAGGTSDGGSISSVPRTARVSPQLPSQTSHSPQSLSG